jgi:competence protein ComEC
VVSFILPRPFLLVSFNYLYFRMWFRVSVLFVAAALGGAALFASGTFAIAPQEPREALLRVVFFDVGQGDAIFIETPEGVQVLIDGARGSEILRALGEEMGFFDRSIDMVLATHPDQDHIGGLPDVLERYEVDMIVMTEKRHTTKTAEAFWDAAHQETEHIVYARSGMQFDLGAGVVLEILFPESDPSALESNASSIVARLTYGHTSFLFTGDAPKYVEEEIIRTDALDGFNDLRTDVLKVGHHGSRTSTSDAFVAWTAPTYGVISAGKDNRYGHPHEEVMRVLEEYHVLPLNTAELGTVTFISNGLHVELVI